ncbi:MAG TPA: response regulator transcription factor [Chitinophagaceae bacterium]|nr:response regulator transcription factor [Chitinophagaceae bacterium]
MEIRVAIFEDNKLMRNGFEAICNGTEGITCCGVFTDGQDLDFKIRRSNPNVILMDIEMPGRDGIAATRQIVKQWPDIKILIQTVFEDDDKIFAAICAGASGYILKSTSPARLVEAIHETYNGGSPMSPYIASRVLKLFQQFAPSIQPEDEKYSLSNREKEVLSLMVEGHNYHVIAEKSFISYETVRTHVKRIYKKLHVASASEAVVKAIRQRLV